MSVMVPARFRSLAREPLLAGGVVLSFALAIGASAAMLGLLTRLMLPAPPGIAQPTRVVRAELTLLDQDGRQHTATTTSYPHFQALAALDRVFTAAAAVQPTTRVLGQGADAHEVAVVAASGDYFTVLGARPVRGRFFDTDDDALPSGSPVAVLSHAFWRSRLAGRPDVVGSSIVLDGEPYAVVGVAPPDFSGDGLSRTDVFVPLSAALRNRGDWWSDPSVNLVSVIARLGEGVSPVAAGAQATAAARAVPSRFGEFRHATVELRSLIPGAVRASTQARIARWLFGVTLIVLVIATANAGTLLLLRALRKRRDVAVRMALGASRRRLAGQLVSESLLLASAGGALGLLLSRWLGEIARVTLLPDLAPTERLLDPRLLAASLGMALLAGLGAGLAPLFLVAQRKLTPELHGAGTLGTVARSRAQRLLVGAQVALCTLLLAGAGLFVRSLQRVQSQELGFSTSGLLFVTLDFREPLAGARRDELHREAVRRLEGARGVSGASVVQASPFGSHHVPPISVPGLAEPPQAAGQLPMLYGATPAYLELLDVELVQGRLFTDQDRRGSPWAALVNETMAREVWPGESALGKCLRVGHDPTQPPGTLASASLPCREIVGVVRDSRVRSLRPVGREASLMQVYVPFEQLPVPMAPDANEVFGLIVGVDGDPARMAPFVQRVIQGNSASPVYARVQPYQDLLDPQLRPWRLGATLFTVFGTLALGIAAVGLFGVVSYLVTQRTREIGLRLALGVTAVGIGRGVVAATLRMVAAGVAAGLALAAIIAPAVRPLLFETSPYQPSVLAVAAAAMLAVAVAAAALPAWRAARVSPMTALRVD
jgi:predicted permease